MTTNRDLEDAGLDEDERKAFWEAEVQTRAKEKYDVWVKPK